MGRDIIVPVANALDAHVQVFQKIWVAQLGHEAVQSSIVDVMASATNEQSPRRLLIQGRVRFLDAALHGHPIHMMRLPQSASNSCERGPVRGKYLDVYATPMTSLVKPRRKLPDRSLQMPACLAAEDPRIAHDHPMLVLRLPPLPSRGSPPE